MKKRSIQLGMVAKADFVVGRTHEWIGVTPLLAQIGMIR